MLMHNVHIKKCVLMYSLFNVWLLYFFNIPINPRVSSARCTRWDIKKRCSHHRTGYSACACRLQILVGFGDNAKLRHWNDSFLERHDAQMGLLALLNVLKLLFRHNNSGNSVDNTWSL